MFKDLQEVMESNSISPKSFRVYWSSIVLDHSNEWFEPAMLQSLRKQLPHPVTKGIYIYEYFVDGKPQVLYIGKSKDIASRLYNHYKERFGLTGHPKWIEFWSSNKHKCTVYYKEIGDEDEYADEALRIITERYLIATLKPQSEYLYKSIK